MTLQGITGFPSGYKAPFSALEIDFAQGPSTSNGGSRDAIYFGPKTSDGTATVNTVYTIRSEGDAETYFGAGSPLHRAIRKHLRTWRGGKVSAICYAETSAGSAGAADGTITIALSSGSNPAASGKHITYVCGERIEVGFDTTDTVTTIAAALVSGVNAKTWLPVTSANVAGVVTLTAKVKGTSQGDGTVGVIRFRTLLEGSGTNVTTTDSGAALGLGTGTAGVEGSTTENTNLEAALAITASARYYYEGITTWSATNLASFKTHLSAKSSPSPGLRCRGFSGYPHTLAGAQALAITLNYVRQHIVTQVHSEHDAAELCGWALARHQKFESKDTRTNLDAATDSEILPAYDQSDWPSDTDKNDAVTDGVMLIGSNQAGAHLVMSVTTRSKDSTGTYDDFRATETHRVSVMDDLGDTMLSRWAVRYGTGFYLMDDEYLSDGSVNPNQDLPPKVVTPSLMRPWASAILQEFSDAGKIQKLSDWEDALRIDVDPNNVSRLEFGDSGRTIDVLHQASFLLSETSPG